MLICTVDFGVGKSLARAIVSHLHTHNHLVDTKSSCFRCNFSGCFSAGIVLAPRASWRDTHSIFVIVIAVGPQCNLVWIFTTCWLFPPPQCCCPQSMLFWFFPIYLFPGTSLACCPLCCCHIAIFKYVRNGCVLWCSFFGAILWLSKGLIKVTK